MSIFSGLKRSPSDDWEDTIVSVAFAGGKDYKTIKEEDAIREARCRKKLEEIEMAKMEREKLRPFWEIYKGLRPPFTFEKAKIRIEKLEEALEDRCERINTVEIDNLYLNGFSDP
ncbi:Carboxylesterase type B [Penicillium cf. griseofulvum]|uniref:Carboxylesterase type B n=1 Tax=Penicillium cf. griseofulvum TaxID=2972120 RepID=A0A9W9N0H1_9EURO|nr:Carboxylesterase type B [Penicillium cf. griseofulvum]KAJ5422358.1 Carboxylesterase type B [Penicillium cf. griseofulvum]KAJ5428541.1 Carboxylesterase type B [Penicillium cf. griseofulvum]